MRLQACWALRSLFLRLGIAKFLNSHPHVLLHIPPPPMNLAPSTLYPSQSLKRPACFPALEVEVEEDNCDGSSGTRLSFNPPIGMIITAAMIQPSRSF